MSESQIKLPELESILVVHSSKIKYNYLGSVKLKFRNLRLEHLYRFATSHIYIDHYMFIDLNIYIDHVSLDESKIMERIFEIIGPWLKEDIYLSQ